MKKKRVLTTVIVLAILCLLIYLQVHAWKRFDWATFWENTGHVSWLNIAGSIALTYVAYALRAVRWRIFLKPMKATTTRRMLAPQFIGFAALALLGRPGEMVRPYLIARKEDLTFTSQVGVWLMERVFDTASVAVMFVALAFLGDPLWQTLPNHRLAQEVRVSASIFFLAVVAVIVVALVLRRSGYAIAERLQKRFEGHPSKLAQGLHSKIVSFTDGLQIISDAGSVAILSLLSMAMWIIIAGAYWLITHAYSGQLPRLGLASLMVLMVAAMFGSLIQLPGVGGGSQLATIAVLNGVFGVDNEVAVSCGMLIWLCTFMSVIPMGLLLAHRERLSLRAVAAEEQQAEATIDQQ